MFPGDLIQFKNSKCAYKCPDAWTECYIICTYEFATIVSVIEHGEFVIGKWLLVLTKRGCGYVLYDSYSFLIC